MGQVYRATDTNLKRQVAIEVLPASVAGDADRLARFQRESEVLAALNRPNIAAIDGLEKTPEFTALVMELVEGDDLSQRIKKGAIPFDEALPIAKQIAEAQEAAHFVRPYELVKKPMAVEPIIASAVDTAAQSTLHSSVRVLTEFPRELPAFPLDAHLLKQALVNLIVNAAQAMPRGGTVTVRATVEPVGGVPWLCVRVQDQGVGLTQRAAEKMFQPFFTTKATGTGLGLAVVKRIVDSHLGEVTARANDEGEGTTFTVRFPPTTETRSGSLTPPRPSPAFRNG